MSESMEAIEIPTHCRICGQETIENVNGVCKTCWEAGAHLKKDTDVKRDTLNFERLEWYTYILKRAIANREPLTAWDACTSMMSHFENVYGSASQELQDSREVDSFDRRGSK